MDGDKGKVFAPNSQVLLGDILGTADYFRGRRMIHFEIISHRDTELTGAPWDDANQRAVDDNQDLICDVPALETFLTGHLHKKLEQIDPIEAAKVLRKSKTRHKSEWALSAENQIETLIPHPQRRSVMWPHIKRFSWVAEAIAANARLSRELGDANGMFWHYHPITFMQDINTLVVAENRTPEDSPNYHKATVEVSADYYLTRFVTFTAGAYVATNVDAEPIRVTEISDAGYKYEFKRSDIACMQPGVHGPETTPPQWTHFSLALLGILEQIHQYLDETFKIALSHICAVHNQAALCVLNNATAANSHQAGNAVDIQPSALTAANCKKLWNAVAAVVDPFNVKDQQYCGMASQADLPDGFTGIRYTTTPAALAPLIASPQQDVPAAEVAGFKIHIELISSAAAAAPTPDDVDLRVTILSVQAMDPSRFTNCGINAVVNGNRVANTFVSSAFAGQVISLDWPVAIHLGQNDQLQVSVNLVGETVGKNDQITLRHARGSNPTWGVGESSGMSSASGFLLRYKVEWHQSDF
jgi:hypothetical protein